MNKNEIMQARPRCPGQEESWFLIRDCISSGSLMEQVCSLVIFVDLVFVLEEQVPAVIRSTSAQF